MLIDTVLSQALSYIICLIMGWVPLYRAYRYLELSVPFKLTPAKARFSMFPFMFLAYMALEASRGYFMMVIVHDWLVLDIDLWVGVVLFLVALSWPVGVASQYRSSIFYGLLGMFAYLAPQYAGVFMLFFLVAYALGVSSVFRYAVAILAIGALGIYSGNNSLYVGLYGVLLVFIFVRHWINFQKWPHWLVHNPH